MSEFAVNAPKDLYSPEILSGISRQLKKRWIILAAVVVPLVIVFIFSMIQRTKWLSMASAVLAGVFAVFWIELFCVPKIRYRALVRTALSGQHHDQTMEFSRVDPVPCMVDGVSCYSLIFLGEPDRHGSREQLFYLDRSLRLPELVPGRNYVVRYSGRTIIGI